MCTTAKVLRTFAVVVLISALMSISAAWPQATLL